MSNRFEIKEDFSEFIHVNIVKLIWNKRLFQWIHPHQQCPTALVKRNWIIDTHLIFILKFSKPKYGESIKNVLFLMYWAKTKPPVFSCIELKRNHLSYHVLGKNETTCLFMYWTKTKPPVLSCIELKRNHLSYHVLN